MWNSENREHQKYLWNVIAQQGKSQLGVRNIQRATVISFEVSSHVLNLTVTGQYTIIVYWPIGSIIDLSESN